MEPARAGDPAPRGFLRVGGETLVRHQLALALAAGCTRIVCVSQGVGPELIELQHAAEREGASFHIVSGPRGLSGLVTAADEVLVVAEGLLVSRAEAVRLLSAPAVLVQPADSGIPLGFERVDINHAAAGLMLVPGRLVDRLMELAADVDAASALLRIALHAGVAQRALPDGVVQSGRWLLVRSETDAQAAEDTWLERNTAAVAPTAGPLLARFTVRKFGPALLHEQRSNVIMAVTAALVAALGVALGWFGHAGLGLIFAGIGWTLHLVASMLGQVRQQFLAPQRGHRWRDEAFSITLDLAIIAILFFALPALPGQYMLERLFAPAMLVGLARVLPRAFPSGLTVWAEDRLALCLLLATMAGGGVLNIGIPAFAALLLLAGLALPEGRGRSGQPPELTRA